MSGRILSMTAVAALLVAGPAAAQEAAQEAAQRAADAAAAGSAARTYRTQGTAPESQAEAIDVQMREAEEQLAAAAARIAELSSSRLPNLARQMRGNGNPVLGITIGGEEDDGPVEGVVVDAVTPGSAAADAGLRAGDIITAINDESLSSDNAQAANRKLLDFMAGVEEGDTLDVEYLRNGRTGSVEVAPRAMHAFNFMFPPNQFTLRAAPAAPVPFHEGPNMFGFYAGGGSWGDMELVPLTEELGRYFGTDKGLLIVRAPGDDDLKLKDGDVIQRIDGREPSSVSHAMRILGSYQGGEKLELEIMRDKKRQTISVEMPDHRRSALRERRRMPPPPMVAD